MNAVVVGPHQRAYTPTSLFCAAFGNYPAGAQPWRFRAEVEENYAGATAKIVEKSPQPRHFCHEKGCLGAPGRGRLRSAIALYRPHTWYGTLLAIMWQCFIISLPPAKEDPAGHRAPTTPVAGPFFRNSGRKSRGAARALGVYL